jgi:hypothetical protein
MAAAGAGVTVTRTVLRVIAPSPQIPRLLTDRIVSIKGCFPSFFSLIARR